MSSAEPTMRSVRLPDAGDALMIEGPPGGPVAARAARREGDVLLVVGAALGRYAGLEVSLLYVAAGIPSRVGARLLGPVGSDDNQVRAALAPSARPVERRRALRAPIRAVARLRGGDTTPPIAASTENLSAWGALVRSRRPLAPGDEYRLELTVRGEPLQTIGRVVRCDPMDGEGGSWRVAFAFPEALWALSDVTSVPSEVEEGGTSGL